MFDFLGSSLRRDKSDKDTADTTPDQGTDQPTGLKVWDETEYYNSEVKPLIEALHQKCLEKNLPTVVSVQHARTSENCMVHTAVVINENVRRSDGSLYLAANIVSNQSMYQRICHLMRLDRLASVLARGI